MATPSVLNVIGGRMRATRSEIDALQHRVLTLEDALAGIRRLVGDPSVTPRRRLEQITGVLSLVAPVSTGSVPVASTTTPPASPPAGSLFLPTGD
jgi:hypothetical protein